MARHPLLYAQTSHTAGKIGSMENATISNRITNTTTTPSGTSAELRAVLI
jgi:hypothetical protein